MSNRKSTTKQLSEAVNQPSYPTYTEISTINHATENRVYDILTITKKEGVRQDAELALHHLRIAMRYVNKALTI